MTTVLLLSLSIAIVLSGALLFTNGVEWLGTKLDLGQGAVGSLLAAVATALPETLIPITAIVRGGTGSHGVATGAILGAPFMLATLALALVGGAAYAWRERRSQGTALDAHLPTLQRDLGFFLSCFTVAFGLGILGVQLWLRVVAAVALTIAYGLYVRLTLAQSGQVSAESELKPLLFDTTRNDPPGLAAVAAQLLVALGAIVGGADMFVDQLVHASERLSVDPLVLSLVIAPLATELPEKVNSIFWTRNGKDTLALGNLTGAMVFQSTLPVAFGLAFTDWHLNTSSVVAGSLALAGVLLATFELRVRRRFTLPGVAVWLLLWLAFVIYVVAIA